MRAFLALLMMILAACSPSVVEPTPTVEDPVTTPVDSGTDGERAVDMLFTGAISGTFTQALLSFQVGQHYTLLLDNLDEANPVQLRLLLAGNIEPGTHEIIAAEDFQLPEGAMVAAHFDLGFPASTYTGSLVLDAIGENSFSGSLELTAQDGSETVTVSGRFDNLNPVIID